MVPLFHWVSGITDDQVKLVLGAGASLGVGALNFSKLKIKDALRK